MTFSPSSSEEFEQNLTTRFAIFKTRPNSNTFEDTNKNLIEHYNLIEEIFKNLLNNIDTHFRIFSSHPSEYQDFISSFDRHSSSFSNAGSDAWPRERVEIITYGALLCYGCALFTPIKSKKIPLKLLNYIPKHFSDEVVYQSWLEYPVLISGIRTQETANQIAETHSKNLELQKDIQEKKRILEKSFEHCTDNFKEIIKASFSALSSSYEEFEQKKEEEQNKLLGYCKWIGIVAVAVALLGIFHGNMLDIYKHITTPAGEKAPEFEDATILSTIALIFCETFLIYAFRIALSNYYAARDELLQLQHRKALCVFAPQFKAFAGNAPSTKNTASEQKSVEITPNNLDEFAKHIFSPLNSRMNPAPHPLDFLGQVTEAVKKAKK